MTEIKNILYRPTTIWVLLFLLTNLIWRGEGATNEASRMAALRSMTDRLSFKIDPVKEWTIDWAQTPDGAYYSNKAPGPMLLGAPVFWLLESLTQYSDVARFSHYQNKTIRSDYPEPWIRNLLSFFMQVVPYAILCLFILKKLEEIGIGPEARHFAAVAMLFAQTASIFMNVYFGHAMAALFVLGAYYFFYTKRFFALGFCLGMAMLSEYTLTLFLPLFFITAFWQERSNWKWLKDTIFGGIAPAILWCWYHISTCGSPFRITAQFQNPMWQNLAQEENNLWGQFAIKFDWNILYELLIGPKRGLLFTQPWVLFLFSFLVFLLFIPQINNTKEGNQTSELASIRFISWSTFLTLFVVNVTFGGWHGGLTSGPRYLSPVLPALALTLALHWNMIPKYVTPIFWLSLIVSILFKSLTMSGTILADLHPLWNFLWWVTKQWPLQEGLVKFWSFLILISLSAGISFYLERNKIKSTLK